METNYNITSFVLNEKKEIENASSSFFLPLMAILFLHGHRLVTDDKPEKHRRRKPINCEADGTRITITFDGNRDKSRFCLKLDLGNRIAMSAKLLSY